MLSNSIASSFLIFLCFWGLQGNPFQKAAVHELPYYSALLDLGPYSFRTYVKARAEITMWFSFVNYGDGLRNVSPFNEAMSRATATTNINNMLTSNMYVFLDDF
ncbi:hypothetical protein AKJ16_DCAP11262 [Drosera capensis]